MKCKVVRGFKLNIKRFSIKSLQAKFLFMLNKFFRRWRSCYVNYHQCMFKKSIGKEGESKKSSDYYGENFVMKDNVPHKNIDIVNDYRLKAAYATSNSFYSEAIADCLDFIKKNSIAFDEKKGLQL
ncbi:hypothetical protein Leryth_013015 [Lithospermum erythrorhizon]|nr:hypothetical protein Leryth_013015 [Lithospermum erythrorhizon]